MLSLIAKIDANRQIILSQKPPPELTEKIHSMSLLKSSLYSARIEGHTTPFEELDEKKKEQMEIFNILRAVEFVNKNIKPGAKTTIPLIKKIHSVAMKNITPDAGQLRRETTAIFNMAGVAVYMPPPPTKIIEYSTNLINYINGRDDDFPLVKAFMSHLIFEKIHPFVDGNGRVGRLLIYAILRTAEYDFGFHVPIEEYIDSHKSGYYDVLDMGLQYPEQYLLYMINAYHHQSESIKNQILTEKNKIMIPLPPRQEEMFKIIRDHKTISLDFLKRRFLKVPERTLRYDLKKMCDKGVIAKIGSTRGAYYSVKLGS